MICGYQNINDYCVNKFLYQYEDIPLFASGDLVTSVIRTDKDTGEVLTIYPDSFIFVEPCDSNDLVEVISAWECYEIFVLNNQSVKEVSSDKVLQTHLSKIYESYDSNLSDGVAITIDNMNTIILDGSTENQIHLGNIASLATILYNIDNNHTMPYILDINNIAYNLNFNDLKFVLIQYFTELAKKKNIKDDSISLLNNTSIFLSDKNLITNYCTNKISDNIQSESTKINLSSIKNPVPCLPPEVCDPPCDPSACETCVNGNCESLCNDGQYCCEGSCQDTPCVVECEIDDDCTYYYCLDSGTVPDCNSCPEDYTCGDNGASIGCEKQYIVLNPSDSCENQLGTAPFSTWTGPFTVNGQCVDNICQY